MKIYCGHYSRTEDWDRTHEKVVAFVLVVLGVDFGDDHVEFKARWFAVDVVVACERVQLSV